MEDYRQRAAATKRARTRDALLEAGRKLFTERGWDATRMEDVAAEAGVSVATAYNHFASKEALLSYAYDEVLEGILIHGAGAAQRVDSGLMSLATFLYAFVKKLQEHRSLTVALVAGLQTAGDAPRPIVQLPEALKGILRAAQRRGYISNGVNVDALAAYHTYAMLWRVVMQPEEPIEATVELVLSQLLPLIR